MTRAKNEMKPPVPQGRDGSPRPSFWPHDLRPWLVVALSFLALAMAYSVRASFGLVMPELEAELGWTRGFNSNMAATALLMTALLAPLGGRLVDRHGARSVIIVGLATLAVGCFWIAATSHPWAFFLAFGGVAALGFGLVATHVVAVAVEQDFDRNQGLATGIATSGATAGQFVIVPLVALAMTAFSWRWAFVALGIGSLVLLLGIIAHYPRGLRCKTTAGAGESRSSLSQDLARILKLPAFQILFWSYFICGYTTSGVIETHFLPYANYCGFGAVTAASAYGVLSAVNLVGMIFAGWLTDRMNRPLLLGGIYVLRGLTFILLASVGVSYELLFIFAILFGMLDYSTVPVTASLIASHIGLRVMGLAFGLISAGHQFGGALGAYLGGYLFDLYARYDWVWWSSLWLAVLAGLLCFTLRDRPAVPAPAE